MATPKTTTIQCSTDLAKEIIEVLLGYDSLVLDSFIGGFDDKRLKSRSLAIHSSINRFINLIDLDEDDNPYRGY